MVTLHYITYCVPLNAHKYGNLRQHLLATGDPLSSFQLHIFILHSTKVSLHDSQFKIILMHL